MFWWESVQWWLHNCPAVSCCTQQCHRWFKIAALIVSQRFFRWILALINHGVKTNFEHSRVPEHYAAFVKILRKRWRLGSKFEITTNLVRLWLGFGKWWNLPDLRQVVEVLLLTVGKCSCTLDFGDAVAGVMDLKESSCVALRAQLVLSWGSVVVCWDEGSCCKGESGGDVATWASAGAKSGVAVVGGWCWWLWCTRGGVHQEMAGAKFAVARICAWHLYFGFIGKSESKAEERTDEHSHRENVG